MNAFQKQIILTDSKGQRTCAADIWRNEEWQTPIASPAPVSIEEFERDMAQVRAHSQPPDGGQENTKGVEP